MSQQTRKKEVDVVICDWCNKEVNTNRWDEHAYIIRSQQDETTKGKKWLIFKRPHPVTFSETRYDFHTDCFEKMFKVAKGTKK